MAKTKALKLPKWIGGIKVPKFLRKSGTIGQWINSPVGRAALAEALIAAGAALKNYKPAADAVGGVAHAANAGSDAATAAEDAVQSAASGWAADVASSVERQIVPASTSGEESGAGKPAKRVKPKQDKPGESPSRH